MCSNFSIKNCVILLKNSTFRKLQVLMKFVFLLQFSVQCIHMLLCVFSRNQQISRAKSFCSIIFCSIIFLLDHILLDHILKECLFPNDLQIITKTQTLFWLTYIWVIPLKIFKQYCNAFGTWSLLSTAHSNHSKKQYSNFTSLCALLFPPRLYALWFFTCFTLRLHLSIKWSEGAIQQLYRKNIYFVKSQDGLFDRNPRQICVEDFIFKFVNFVT